MRQPHGGCEMCYLRVLDQDQNGIPFAHFDFSPVYGSGSVKSNGEPSQSGVFIGREVGIQTSGASGAFVPMNRSEPINSRCQITPGKRCLTERQWKIDEGRLRCWSGICSRPFQAVLIEGSRVFDNCNREGAQLFLRRAHANDCETRRECLNYSGRDFFGRARACFDPS